MSVAPGAAPPLPVNEPKRTTGMKALIATLVLVALLVAGCVAYFAKGRAERVVGPISRHWLTANLQERQRQLDEGTTSPRQAVAWGNRRKIRERSGCS